MIRRQGITQVEEEDGHHQYQSVWSGEERNWHFLFSRSRRERKGGGAFLLFPSPLVSVSLVCIRSWDHKARLGPRGGEERESLCVSERERGVPSLVLSAAYPDPREETQNDPTPIRRASFFFLLPLQERKWERTRRGGDSARSQAAFKPGRGAIVPWGPPVGKKERRRKKKRPAQEK